MEAEFLDERKFVLLDLGHDEEIKRLVKEGQIDTLLQKFKLMRNRIEYLQDEFVKERISSLPFRKAFSKLQNLVEDTQEEIKSLEENLSN